MGFDSLDGGGNGECNDVGLEEIFKIVSMVTTSFASVYHSNHPDIHGDCMFCDVCWRGYLYLEKK